MAGKLVEGAGAVQVGARIDESNGGRVADMVWIMCAAFRARRCRKGGRCWRVIVDCWWEAWGIFGGILGD